MSVHARIKFERHFQKIEFPKVREYSKRTRRGLKKSLDALFGRQKFRSDWPWL